jgi:hypothetical protein
VPSETAAQFEDLALGGFEGLPELMNLLAVSLLERAQLDGQGAHDAARGVVAGRGRGRQWGVLLLRPQVFNALADRCAAVEKVQGDTGRFAKPRKVIGSLRRIISRSPCSALACAAALLRAAARRRLSGLPRITRWPPYR